MAKLSVVITAYNEEAKIKDCLESVKDLADEIIVVDNDSTDRTAEIARKYTKYVFHQKNDPKKIDLQKNFGFAEATGEWILSLDADECVTQELVEEIKKVIKVHFNSPLPVGKSPALVRGSREEFAGYFIPRKNIIFGKWIEHTGWYPDEQLRLFKKGKGKYISAHYHEPMIIDGEIGHLSQPLLHRNYETIPQFLRRNLLVYAPNEADTLLANGYEFDWNDAIWFPVKEFLSRYFSREGYKDGLHGLVLSLLMSYNQLAIFCYVWEKTKFDQIKIQEFASIQKELENAGKEIRFWIYDTKVKGEKDEVKRSMLKIKRKFFR